MTNAMDAFITILVRILEVMFVAGLAGSAIVLVSTIINIVTTLDRDQPEAEEPIE